jgi:hypothetical protein
MCSSGLILNPYIYTNFPACSDTILSRVFVPWNNLYHAREVCSRVLRSLLLITLQSHSLAAYICSNSLKVFFLLPLEFRPPLRYLMLLLRSMSATQRAHVWFHQNIHLSPYKKNQHDALFTFNLFQ